MDNILFGWSIPNGPFEEMIKQGLMAEKYGFDTLSVGDHLLAVKPEGIYPDAWTLLGVLAVKTKNIRLMPGVTDPFRRHPSSLAHAIATLDGITRGRTALGIGAGEAMNLLPFGIPLDKPVQRLREAIQYIKLLWSSSPDGPVTYKGEFYSLKNAFLADRPLQKPHPPIYIGALGPRTRELVGKIGDGWFPWLVTVKLFKDWLRDIQKAAKQCGRSLRQIDLVARFYTAVSNTPREIRPFIMERGKRALVMERRILKTLHYELSIPNHVLIQRYIPTRESWSLLERLKDEVPPEVVDMISVYGTVDDCIDKIENYIKAGARHIFIYNVNPNVDETIKHYGETIIPYFKEK